MTRPENVRARRLFAAMALLLVVSIAFVFVIQWHSVGQHHSVSTEIEVLRDLRETLTTMLDLETGTRGYVLGGEEKYLEPFDDAVAHLDENLSNLRGWADAGELDGPQVARVEDLAARKLAHSRTMIAARRTKGFEAALEVYNNGVGKELMDAIRIEIAAMERKETKDFMVANHRVHNAERLNMFAYIAVAVVNLAFLRWAFARLAREISTKNDTIGELEHFSYTLMHDMRAPLRSIRAFAEMMGEHCAADGLMYLDKIKTSTERMDLLVRDALQYSRLVTGAVPIGPVPLRTLIEGIVESYPEFRRPDVEITIKGELPDVYGNQALLTQCVSNLLTNAVKFVAPGTVPKVEISAQKLDGFVRVCFKDNGIGIAPDYHEKIFSMFEQLSKEKGGTGIGLALVRKAAERLGGKVGVESEEGHGSCFWLDLKAA